MADMNGWDLAGDFFQSVFPDRIYGKQGKHHYYYERPARAPRDAVNVTAAEKQTDDLESLDELCSLSVVDLSVSGQVVLDRRPPHLLICDVRQRGPRIGLVSRIWYV